MVLDAPDKVSVAQNETALDRLFALTQKSMERVNTLILQRTESHVENVPELARYLIEAGGKRLRPMLTLASADLFGNPNGNEIRFAAAVEFMHNATLLHDDVVDESEMRRGKPAARKVWGNQESVLVGDFLLGQAFLMMVETGDLEALRKLASAAAIIAEGEVFQLSRAGQLETTEADYEQIIRAKTATLFESSTMVGAMAGGASAEQLEPIGIYGLELGRAFQLVDDVLDYSGATGTLGKNTGDDLREGKMTLPVILALKTVSGAERQLLTEALGNPSAGGQMFDDVLAVLERHNCLGRTLDLAFASAHRAQDQLLRLPKSDKRDLLGDIAEFCVARAV